MTSRVKENSIDFSSSIEVKRINSLISILLSKLLQLKAIKITQNLIVKRSVTLMNCGVLEFSQQNSAILNIQYKYKIFLRYFFKFYIRPKLFYLILELFLVPIVVQNLLNFPFFLFIYNNKVQRRVQTSTKYQIFKYNS